VTANRKAYFSNTRRYQVLKDIESQAELRGRVRKVKSLREGSTDRFRTPFSMLFDSENARGTNTTFIVVDNDNNTGTSLIVASRIWDVLIAGGGHTSTLPARIAVSISLPHVSRLGNFNSVIQWATLGEEVRYSCIIWQTSLLTVYQAVDSIVPKPWLSQRPDIFGIAGQQRCINLTAVQPVLLRTLFISALSTRAYEAAQSDLTLLESLFSENMPIVHQGDIYHTSHGSQGDAVLRYLVLMAEPVMQGYARAGETQFILVSNPQDGSGQAVPTIDDRPSRLPDLPDDSSEDLSIDERFLASSVLMSSIMSASLAPINGVEAMHVPGQANGLHASPATERPSALQVQSFATDALDAPLLLVEEDLTVHLGIAALTKVGILDGDWVRGHIVLC
jgi:hypothetical protein